MKLMPLVLVGTLLFVPTVASATPTLTSPAPGASRVLNVRGQGPILRWTLPPGHRTEYAIVARRNAVDDDGKLEHGDDFLWPDSGDPSPTAWRPDIRYLRAGRWYWQVQDVDSEGLGYSWSEVRSFVVPTWFNFATPKMHQVTREAGYTSLEWNYHANRNVRIVSTVALFHGKRRVGWHRSSDFASTPFDYPETGHWTWTRPASVPRGARIRAVFTLRFGGRAKSRTRFFFSS